MRLIVIGVLLVLVSVPLCLRETRYIDCRSGRIMRQVHVAGLLVRQQIEETAFSRIVGTSEHVNGAAAEWKMYFSYSLLRERISPHYRFHSVPYDLDGLVVVLHVQQQSEEEVRVRCLEALKFLNAQDVEGLWRYCESLSDGMAGNQARRIPGKSAMAEP